MISQDGKYTIIFNGEIYNHDYQRKDLIKKGYPIKTHSDTEAGTPSNEYSRKNKLQ